MKRYEIKKALRTFGSKDPKNWYTHENVATVEAANVTMPVNGRLFPAAWFVVEVTDCYDPMREFNTHYAMREGAAGPFATEEDAKAWADAH